MGIIKLAGCKTTLANYTQNMKNFWRGFCWFIITLFVWFGLQSAGKLWIAITPSSAFVVVPGKVTDVVRHNISTSTPYGFSNQHLAEVKFIYAYLETNYSGNTLSPLCNYCSPEVVLNALGERPSQIIPGRSVQVLVKRDSPKIAYLTLPTSYELFEQLMFTLVFLLVSPAFAYWWFQTMGKPTPSSEG